MCITIPDRRRRVALAGSALAAMGFVLAGCSDGSLQAVERMRLLAENPTPENLERIRARLEDEDREVRIAALHALAAAVAPDAADRSREALEDPDPAMRASAAHCLGILGDSAAEGALAEHVLLDEDPQVRRRAAQALESLGSPGAVDALVRALDDPAGEVRLAAAQGLAALDPGAAFEVLARLVLEDPSWKVRVESALALGKSRRAAAAPVLRAAGADPNEFVRAAARQASRQIEGRRSPEPGS